MAKSFSQVISDFKILANDSSGTVESLAKTLMNLCIRKTLGLADFTFNKDTRTYASGTSVQDYEVPFNMFKPEKVRYWYGNVWYNPIEVKNEKEWEQLNSILTYANIPTHWHISYNTNKVSFFPIINTSNGTIELGFTKRYRELGVADYRTGTIAVSSGSVVFTGGGGATFNERMEGRYLKMSDTATPIDEYWFEIVDYKSTTRLETRQLAPNAVSSGGTYIIAELIPLPDGFEDIPIWYALDKFYQMKEKPILAREYERMWKESTQDLIRRDNKTVSGILEKETPIEQINPNYNPWNMEIK